MIQVTGKFLCFCGGGSVLKEVPFAWRFPFKFSQMNPQVVEELEAGVSIDG